MTPTPEITINGREFLPVRREGSWHSDAFFVGAERPLVGGERVLYVVPEFKTPRRGRVWIRDGTVKYRDHGHEYTARTDIAHIVDEEDPPAWVPGPVAWPADRALVYFLDEVSDCP